MLKRIFNYIIFKGSEINEEHFSYILRFEFEIKRFLKKKTICNVQSNDDVEQEILETIFLIKVLLLQC